MKRNTVLDALAQVMETLGRPQSAAHDRQLQIGQHIKALTELQQLDDERRDKINFVMSQTSNAPNASLPVVPILSDNVITINDIVSAGRDVVHKGKILLCRSILPTFKISSVNVLVDDPDGKYVMRLALYNFSKTIPVGTILALMHPWFKTTGDGSAGLRCENPMHVYFVKSTDQILQNVIWKADLPVESGVKKNLAASQCKSEHDNPANQGTRYFTEKNYMKALEMYTKATELNPKNPILFSNRALTYLALQKPSEALADAEMGIILDKSHLKSLYRKAKALLMLKRYREAVDFLDETQHRLKKELAGNREFTKLMEISKNMMREFETGFYALDQIEEEATKCKILQNHADFAASSTFEKKKIAGKGRGLFATGDMLAETLIMACKAFAFAISTKDEVILATNIVSNKIEAIGFTSLVQQICDKLMANPELGRDFYQLYAGPTLGVLRDYDPSNPVDVDRISAIVRMNSFSNEITELALESRFDHDTGVWLLPSYFNHSCGDYNCCWQIIGDFLFVKTTESIKPGEELLISYVTPSKSYEQRSLSFEKHWGFTCGCSLCVADRQRLG